MPPKVLGIHHVTAIATDPQINLAFYRDVLGMRLVKKTVNFEDPSTYHFYFGDELGRPGTLLTFFPWPLARRGSRGAGQVTVTAFSVPEGSLPWWSERLSREGIVTEGPFDRWEEQVLTVLDPDGLVLELVAHPGAAGMESWKEGPLATEVALRGLHSVTLTVNEPAGTARLLTEILGFAPGPTLRDRARFEVATRGAPGVKVDVLHDPGAGAGWVSAGTAHHVAWRAEREAEQLDFRDRLLRHGLEVTPVLDRNYFRSIYFREPGGVLFEIATDGPGFTIDEPASSLGAELKLPAWLEPQRSEIAAVLPEVST